MAVWRVVCSGGLYSTESWANVFHINPAGAFDAEAVFDAFEAAYLDNAAGGGMGWLNPCPGTIESGRVGVTMNQITLQAVTNPAIPLIRQVAGLGGQNTLGGLPLDVAAVISWRTALAGRSFRGRTYLPPFHENQNVDATAGPPKILGSTVTALTINAAKLIDDLVTANAVLAVYSRTLTAANTITGGYMDDSWDTQRRRGRSVTSVRTIF